MTRIDFYVLSTDSADARLRVACRIAQKAVQRRHHVFVNAADEGDAGRLDDLLWTFSQGSFIPTWSPDGACRRTAGSRW